MMRDDLLEIVFKLRDCNANLMLIFAMLHIYLCRLCSPARRSARWSVKMFFLCLFLVADTRLYTLACRSVRRSVRPSVTFLNCDRFSHYCSCQTVRDWIAVYPALLLNKRPKPQKNQRLCERSFKCDVAGHSSFFHLEMA